MRLQPLLSLLLITLAVPSELGAAQVVRVPRDVGAPRRETTAAVISGRVIAADTNLPLRRVEVTAANGNFVPRSTYTDDEGRFVFSGLEAGAWQLAASKAGYITQVFGQRRPFGAARPVVVADGQQLTADVALTRSGAIAGRVYDEFGEPLAAVRVSVMRSRIVQGRRQLATVSRADLTDDTGSFRIYGLPPGEYYVAASLRVAPIDSVVETTFAPTYYPGTGNMAEAQRVLLGPAADVSVDFPLLAYRTARVSGVVINASGAPADAFLNLTSDAGELGVPLGVGGATREDGTFTLPDVPPGSYTLIATAKNDSGPSAENASIPLTVYGDDVTGITVVTARPGTVRGTIAADAGVTRRLPATVDISARSTSIATERTWAQTERNVFELIVPAGAFRVNVDPPDGWMVKAINVNGVDALDAPIDLRGEQDVPVRVVLTDRVTELSGTISSRDSAPGVGIVIFPEDSSKWTLPSRHVRTARANENGTFRIAGLAPGERYLAIALDDLEEGEGDDPELLARLKALATPFSLDDGEKRTLDLTLVQR
jgi:hypothetical protein